MSPNKMTVERYMDGFNKSDHEQILSCLADDIEWLMSGAFHLVGKDAFDKEIENDAFTDRDERLSGTGWSDNFDPTCRNDEERHDLLSRLDEHLSRSDRTRLSMNRDPFNLSRRQRREHALKNRGERQRS